MQNFQVIVLSVWEPTDKISHLHDCTFNKEIKKHFELEETLLKTSLSRTNFVSSQRCI